MIELTKVYPIHTGTPHLEGVEYLYSLSNADGVYGEILFEITPYFALIHPRLFKCNKTTLAALRMALFEVGKPLLFGKYEFDKAHFATTNHKLVKLLLGDKVKVETENLTPGIALYYYEAE